MTATLADRIGKRTWVIVPSAAIAHEVEHELLDSGRSFAGTLAMTPAQAVRTALAERGAPMHRTPSTVTLLAWLREAITDTRHRQPRFHRDELAYLAEFATARRSLLRSLLDLRLFQAAYGIELPQLAERAELLRSFFDDLSGRLHQAGFDDPARRLARASRALEQPHPNDPDLVLVRGRAAYDSPELIGIARTLAARVPFGLDEIEATASTGTRPYSVVSAQGAFSELLEAVARARTCMEKGAAAHRIGIVVTRRDPYESFAPGVFASEDVPFTAEATARLAQTPMAVLVSQLTALVAHGVTRQVLATVLTASSFDPTSIARHGLNATQIATLDRETRKARCLDGADVLTCLDQLVEARPSATTTALRDAVAHFLTRIAETRAKISGAKSATQQARALVDFIVAFLRDDVAGARDDLLARVAGLEERDRLGLGAVTIDDLERDVGDRLQEGTLPPVGAHRDGVKFVPLERSRDLVFDHVFVLGMNRGALPRRHAEDPWLGADDVEKLRQLVVPVRAAVPDVVLGERPRPKLPDEAEQVDLDDLTRLVGGATTAVTVSWLRADESGQPKAPSPWLRILARELGPPSDERIAASPRERVRGALQAHRALSESDALLVAAFAGGGKSLTSLAGRLLDDATAIERAVTWQTARDSFDGGDATRHAFDPIHLGANPKLADTISASGLESFGKCPLRFWFERVLGATALEDEPTPDTVSRQEIGIAVHEVLQRVYEQLIAANALTSSSAHEQASALLDKELQRTRAALLTPQARRLRLLADHVFATWSEGLGRIVELDVAEILERGLRPAELEVEVSRELDFDSPASPGTRLTLRARLDRLDRDDEGNTRIIDYKTGSFDPTKDLGKEVLRGEKLQLAIYALLLQDAATLPEAELRGVAPDHLAKARDALPRRSLSSSLQEHPDGVRETLGILATTLASGSFPFRRGHQCNFCRFRAACPRHHAPTAARLSRVDDLSLFWRLETKTLKQPLLVGGNT